MTYEFGYRAKPKDLPFWVYGLGVAVIFGVGLTVVSYVAHKGRNQAEARAWDIHAPPCPEVSAEAFMAQPVRVKSQVEYDAMTIGRAFGHLECEDVSYGGWRHFQAYPACQLTGPGVLTVKIGSRQTYFLPGFGKRTTIAIKDGKLTCVLDGDFGKRS